MGPVCLLESLFELIYPQRCSLCGMEPGQVAWSPGGVRVKGLRFWDETHLCRCCAAGLAAGGVSGQVRVGNGDPLPVAAAALTNPDLVKLVGQFKYHGVRGLSWPLARMLRAPLAVARDRWGTVDALVPIALHRRRRRTRGFNQAEILARLLQADTGIPARTDILVRHRNTGQQAKIVSPTGRQSNLAASFRSRPFASLTAGSGAGRIGLLDDLATSGWTVMAAAESLRAAGWDVRWVLALGVAVGLAAGQETPAAVLTPGMVVSRITPARM